MTRGKRRGLGSSLLAQGEGSNVEDVLTRLKGDGAAEEVPVDLVDPSPFQARREIGEDEIEELAASIRESGLLQPVLVRRIGSRYELLAGERRWRAFQRLGRERIPAQVRAVDDATAAIIGAVENVQRENLGAWEEAHAVGIVREQLGKAGLGSALDDLAQVFGWSTGKVSERLTIIEAFPESRLKREGVDLHGVKELPKSALLRAARASSSGEQTDLLKVALGASAPGKEVKRASRRKAGGRPPEAFTLKVPKSGRVSLNVRTPIDDMKPDDAKRLLDRLDPILKALKKQARAT